MSEQERPKTSEMLNRAFTVPIMSFQEKRNQGHETLESEPPSLHIEKLPVQSFAESDQTFLDQFPDIYDHKTEGKEYLKGFDGMNLVTPIGEYGEEWAKQLITATHKLRTEALGAHHATNVIGETELLKEQRAEILLNASDGKHTVDTLGSFTPFDEGIQSVLFAAGLLTASKIEGYDKPEDLLKELTNQKIFSKLALVIPSTISARLGNRGWTFTPPVLQKDEDKLAVSKRLINHFIQQRDGYTQLATPASQLLDKNGCPVARTLPENDLSGVDMTAQLLSTAIGEQSKQSDKNDRPE